MTCLTLTPASVAEALERDVQLVVAHHPLPFQPLSKITTLTQTGQMLWQLAGAQVSVYCPHTAWDSAALGINALLAEKLSLTDVQPLQPSPLPELVGLGAGRWGRLQQPTDLRKLADRLPSVLPHCRLRCVDVGRPISTVAIACGSGGSLLKEARRLECDLFLTGEATFHTCLEAQASGISLLMTGHFASEHFSMKILAQQLADAFTDLKVQHSLAEADPVRNL